MKTCRQCCGSLQCPGLWRRYLSPVVECAWRANSAQTLCGRYLMLMEMPGNGVALQIWGRFWKETCEGTEMGRSSVWMTEGSV
jgi:hypothetical protein